MPLLMYKDPTTGEMTPLIGARSAGRNIVVNGSMRVAQRGAAAPTYIADRWLLSANWDGTYTPGSQETSSPPPGFSHYIRAKVATADASLVGEQYSHLYTQIEGYRISHLGWGTASAKAATLSFWVRTSIPGIWSGSLRSVGATPSYTFEYTTTSTGWEYKTITVPGPTVGTWPIDTAFCSLAFNQGMSTTCTYRSTTPKVWQVGNFIGSSNQTNMLGTVNATFDLTGVQFEEGSYATPFERVSYDDELRACQRYYYRLNQSGSSTRFFSGWASTAGSWETVVHHPVPMRAKPVVGKGGVLGLSNGAVYGVTDIGLASYGITEAGPPYSSSGIQKTGGTGSMTPLCLYYLETAGPGSAYVEFSAEL